MHDHRHATDPDPAPDVATDGGALGSADDAATTTSRWTTLQLGDHHLVLDTPDGPALGVWRDLDAAIAFARTLVAADRTLRIVVSTWPDAALGHLAEHAHRQGWRVGFAWEPETALTGSGRSERARGVLEEVAAAGGEVPSRTAPIVGPPPVGRHHVWHDGDRVDVVETDLEGNPR